MAARSAANWSSCETDDKMAALTRLVQDIQVKHGVFFSWFQVILWLRLIAGEMLRKKGILKWLA